MTDENRGFVTTLDCSHCGDDAIESADGLFYDGEGDECQSCGFPGMVSVYGDGDDAEAVWRESEEDDAVCNNPKCEDCKERRAGLGIKEGQ